ncbi:hypothetical protein [Mesorhizobium sp. J428]|uniref:hypothetical protein n=1 Tax=Mesorhizobium sp. J428 TaxID=2898440 RepID=UPI00215130D4|nr:hypothetical protein [Mesorhizobium sp. J428]MCR5859011.1 hypothetical protein [Mesorhizobium sp. J428]
MHVVVEFYRTRDVDDAHAVVGRETTEAADLDDAVEVARRLSETLDMPQRPDAMTITDAAGAVLYAGAVEADASDEERQRS